MRVIPVFAVLLAVGLLAAAPAPALAGPGDHKRHVRLKARIEGAEDGRPATEHVHEMKTRAREVILHLEFRNGLYRLSRHDNTRGTTAGVYIEVNDADDVTHPVRNPYCPLPVQRKWNPAWKEFVSAEFPHPNPEPGYWYTWGRDKRPVSRPIRLRFAEAGRFRIRVRGVTRQHRKDVCAPTLVGVTELGTGPGPDYRKRIIADRIRVERAVPTGRKRSSVLELQREVPTTIRAGRPFEYTIRVTNLTDRPVRNVVLREDGEGALDYKKGATAELGGTATWKLGTIPPHRTKTLEITAVAVKRGPLKRALSVRYDSRPLEQTIDVIGDTAGNEGD